MRNTSPKPGNTYEFTASAYEHGSWGARDLEAGKPVRSTMQWIEGKGAGHASIEWDLPTLDRCEEIGLWFNWRAGKRVLVDYDGIMALPAQAVIVMQREGVEVLASEGFADELAQAAALTGREIPRLVPAS